MGLWLYKALLVCTHLVYSIFYFLSNIWSYFKRRITFTGDFDHFSRSVDTKIPEHIVFVINANDAESYVNLDDISLLVQWSVMLGIKHISLYDNKRYLINCLDLFEEKLSNKFNSKQRITFKGSQQNGSIDHNIIYYTSQSLSTIRILSMLDFKGSLSMAAKELIRRQISKSGSTKDCKSFTPSDIEQFLNYKLNIPNPELAVICSSTPCLLGLLPWHIKLTEIVTLPKFGSLIPQDFIQVINRYSMCQQRFGK